MIGISVKPTIGIGDGLQFSSLPENYYRATGKKLFDLSRPWFFDRNPYVVRDAAEPLQVHIDQTIELWNFSPSSYQWPDPRLPHEPKVYLSNAEIWAGVLRVPVVLNRPRLYQYEDFPFSQREKILLHTSGMSHGEMPKHIVEHIIKKYAGTGQLFQVGPKGPYALEWGLPRLETPTLWDFAELVSKARMFIGMDSGPSWIASCYHDVVVKKLRVKPNPPEEFSGWVPLKIHNIHSHWDDRIHQTFNVTDRDIGFTYSYKRL